jgi:prepilin-type N-terminal cleavage/methylation domain-containing protein
MRRRYDRGFSLVEVMVAMSISTIVVMGGMAALQVSARLAQQGVIKTRAMALAQGRLEAKRSVRWEALLQDDLDHDGRTDVMMADDGQGADVSAGDGIYSAQWERDGVTLKWTVAMDRLGPLSTAGLVTIRAAASYRALGSVRVVEVGTVRANPTFTGAR